MTKAQLEELESLIKGIHCDQKLRAWAVQEGQENKRHALALIAQLKDSGNA